MSTVRSQKSADPIRAIDLAVGTELKGYRLAAGMTIRTLAKSAGVSDAMISRIENGYVSAPLATLEALAEGLQIPIVNLFRATVRRSDVTHVKAGGGLKSRRHSSQDAHDFMLLGYHKRRDVQFEPYKITFSRDTDTFPRPLQHNTGCEFIYVLSGEMIYRYRDARYRLREGDSLSFDSGHGHAVEDVLTEAVTFLNVFAQKL